MWQMLSKGVSENSQMTFPETTACLKINHDSFDSFSEDPHYIWKTPLESLSIGLVTSFPLDYMHLVCLGVTHKLISLCQKGPLKTRLGPTFVQNVSSQLTELCPHTPSEINRKQRSLLESDCWKATEFRTFLLYTAPVCLKGNVPKAMYENFMLFAVAMTIFLSPSLCADYAGNLLVLFVDHCSCLSGKETKPFQKRAELEEFMLRHTGVTTLV